MGSCNFHFGQNGTFAARNPQCTPIRTVHQVLLIFRMWKKLAVGEDELVQEKPFLEMSVVCAASVLQKGVLVLFLSGSEVVGLTIAAR